MRIITVSLYCQALKTLNWILKPDHNLPIEPLFVSDMAVAAADTSAAVDSS